MLWASIYGAADGMEAVRSSDISDKFPFVKNLTWLPINGNRQTKYPALQVIKCLIVSLELTPSQYLQIEIVEREWKWAAYQQPFRKWVLCVYW